MQTTLTGLVLFMGAWPVRVNVTVMTIQSRVLHARQRSESNGRHRYL